MKSKMSTGNTELETNFKQEKLSHQQTKKDLKALETKYEETNEYLKKEVVKSTQMKRETKEYKLKVVTLEEEIESLQSKIQCRPRPMLQI